MILFNKRKIFCVGANKTGTTSIAAAFKQFGLRVGKQSRAEVLIHEWERRDFSKIIKYCRNAEAYQDIPFSYPFTYQALDAAYPGSKFILTVRSDAAEWYESLLRFHKKIMGIDRLPTADDLKKFDYRYVGFLWDAMKARYGADEYMLYNRDYYMKCYDEHNNAIINYFVNRPNDLLKINIADSDAMERLAKFLGFRYSEEKMPRLNSSKN